jgi:hypothetical protein
MLSIGAQVSAIMPIDRAREAPYPAASPRHGREGRAHVSRERDGQRAGDGAARPPIEWRAMIVDRRAKNS